MSDVYWRIFLSRNDLVTVVEMQDFDEDDYDQSRFFTNDLGNKLKFDDEKEAIDWLNACVIREKIDPEYRKEPSDSDHSWQKGYLKEGV